MSAPDPLARNRELVGELDGRFRRPLMSYFLRRLGNRTDAEDLTQQVFTRLLGSDALSELEHAERFVFTIASNLLKDRGRNVARKWEQRSPIFDPELVAEISREAWEERSPERVLLSRETLTDVFRALGELDEKTRDVFVLHRLENMKHREIAEIMGISVSMVEKHVAKATLHLARRYGRQP